MVTSSIGYALYDSSIPNSKPIRRLVALRELYSVLLNHRFVNCVLHKDKTRITEKVPKGKLLISHHTLHRITKIIFLRDDSQYLSWSHPIFNVLVCFISCWKDWISPNIFRKFYVLCCFHNFNKYFPFLLHTYLRHCQRWSRHYCISAVILETHFVFPTSTACPPEVPVRSAINRDAINQVKPSKHF